MPKAEQITAPDSIHGEGPVWSTDWDGLRWVDMLAGDVLHLDPRTGEVSRWHVGKVAAALRPRTSGGAVIATEREFLLCDQINGPLHHPVEGIHRPDDPVQRRHLRPRRQLPVRHHGLRRKPRPRNPLPAQPTPFGRNRPNRHYHLQRSLLDTRCSTGLLR